MKVAFYVRLSTEEQAIEGFSIRCNSSGYEVVKVYKDDGFSAKTLNRPPIKETTE